MVSVATPVSFYQQSGPCPSQQRHATLAAPGAADLTPFHQPAFRSLFGKNRKDCYDREVRRQTLTYLPAITPVDCDELLNAGFCYTGDGDIVECFCCCTKYGNWKVDDKPLEVHRRLSPNCPYLNSITNHRVSDEFEGQFSSRLLASDSAHHSSSESEVEDEIDGAIEVPRRITNQGASDEVEGPVLSKPLAHQSSSESRVEDVIDGAVEAPRRRQSSASKAKHLKSRTSRIVLDKAAKNALKQENERMKSSITCKHCRTEKVQTLYLPCRHLIACESCADKIEDCLLCNQKILGTVRIFLA